MLILVEVCLLTTVLCHRQLMLKLESMVSSMHGQQHAWSEKGMRSLVEFVALYWDHADKSTHRPKHRDKEFWGNVLFVLPKAPKR